MSSYVRYMEKNVRCHSMYRKYNDATPTYLQNRPRNFVNHCLQKITLAEDINAAEDVTCADHQVGEFNIKSQSEPDQWYTLKFGQDDPSCPKCSCPSWQRGRLPCKHYPVQWNWDKLPVGYRNSPYFNLDSELFSTSPVNSSPTSDLSEQCTDADDAAQRVEAPKKSRQKRSHLKLSRSAGQKCREVLDHIRQCTYVIENEKALQKLKSDLRGLLLDIQSVIPTAHGLTVEGGEAPKKRRAPNPDTRRTCYAALPLRPPKNKFKGRVGQRASIGRNTYKVKLNVQGKRCQAKTPPDARPSEGSHERPKRTTCRAPELGIEIHPTSTWILNSSAPALLILHQRLTSQNSAPMQMMPHNAWKHPKRADRRGPTWSCRGVLVKSAVKCSTI